MAAVNQGGLVLNRDLKFASYNLCRDRDIVMSAIKIFGGLSSYHSMILEEIGR